MRALVRGYDASVSWSDVDRAFVVAEWIETARELGRPVPARTRSVSSLYVSQDVD